MPDTRSADQTQVDPPREAPVVTPALPLSSSNSQPPRAAGGDRDTEVTFQTPQSAESLSGRMAGRDRGRLGQPTEQWLADRFEILEKLGQGGMGQVFRAFDPRLQRFVALKLPLGNLSENPADRERFLREGRAAAVIKHPNVVSVYEIYSANEQFCIVCEYVAGPTLKAWLSDQAEALPPRIAAQLLRSLASGIQAAHERGVYHRDLKPANVLLERCSGESSRLLDVDDSASSTHQNDYFVHAGKAYRPRITDFGLAAFDEQVTQLTRTGCMLGTASYMSPEQAEGRHANAQTDVFALGIILYEVLCKRSPFAAETYAATIDRIRNHEPLRPFRVQPGVPKDLSAICECALSKEMTRRYSSVADMEADLGRFLAGVPVHARTIGPVGKLSRWSKRNPLATTLTMLVCFALGLTLWQNGRLAESLDDSETLRRRADIASARLTETNAMYRREVYVQDMILAFDAWEERESTRVQQILDKHLPVTEEEEQRGFEWTVLDRLCDLPQPRAFEGHAGDAYDVSVVPGGREFFTTGADHLRKRWSVEATQPTDSAHTILEVMRALAISPDGGELFCGSNFLHGRSIEHGGLSRWLPISRHKVGIRAIAISPDASLIASTSFHTDLQIKSLVRGLEYSHIDVAIPTPNSRRIEFSPDGRFLYFACMADDLPSGTALGIWDVEQQKIVQRIECLDGFEAGSLDVSADGNFVAVAASNEIHVLDTRSGGWIARTKPHRGRVLDVEFSPSVGSTGVGSTSAGRTGSDRLGCATQDGTLSLYAFAPHVKSGVLPRLHAVREFANCMHSLAWASETQIITADEAGRVRMHTIEDARRDIASVPSRDARLLDDGRVLLCRDDGGRLQVIDVASGNRKVILMDCDLAYVNEAAAKRSIGRLALCEGSRIGVWDLETGCKQHEFKHGFLLPELSGRTNSVTGLSFSSDGSRLATIGTADHSVQIWDLGTGRRERAIRMSENGYTVCFSPDNRYILFSGDSKATLHEFATGANHTIAISRLWRAEWLTSEKILLAGQDHQLSVFDVSSGKVVRQFEGQSQLSNQLVVSPDLRTLVTGGDDGLYFWHLESARLLGHIKIDLVDMAFLPDGSDLQVLVRDPESRSQMLRWQTLSTVATPALPADESLSRSPSKRSSP